MAHVIDGVELARERVESMRSFVASLPKTPSLIALASEPDIPTQQFLKIKKRVAERIGVSMVTKSVAANFHEAKQALATACADADGVVVQLPFPESVDMDALLSHLPAHADPDCLGTHASALLERHESPILPPVISAVRAMCIRYGIVPRGKRVVVVGQGRLVGAPGARWFEEEGAEVVRVTKSSTDLPEILLEADILLLGAGAPGLVLSEHIREGVVIFDAGTSETGGKVVGDAEPACQEKASFFTPVPGGIGPLAVAELFANLLRLRFDYRDEK